MSVTIGIKGSFDIDRGLNPKRVEISMEGEGKRFFSKGKREAWLKKVVEEFRKGI